MVLGSIPNGAGTMVLLFCVLLFEYPSFWVVRMLASYWSSLDASPNRGVDIQH